MAVKICDNINQHRTVSLANFIGGFDIDHVGTRIVNSLIENGFNSLDKITTASNEELYMCFGINTVLADHIKQGILKVRNEMEKVLEQQVAIVDNERGKFFDNKSACFTGSFIIYPRKELEKIFTSLGGKVSGKVSSNTSFLVSNDGVNSTSNKTMSAIQYNIPIINENEFLNMIRGVNYGK
jgi:DNA ligase (NAD+)